MTFYERHSYFQPLEQLIREVLTGEIRVPRFQRPGSEITWRPEQRGDLLDSLYRGYPVGTILLWSTTLPVDTLDVVGGFRIPELQKGRPLRLLLDGYQRIVTLIEILGQGLVGAQEGADCISGKGWAFDMGVPNDGARVRFSQESHQDALPLRIVLNRAEFNRWLREHAIDDDKMRLADSLRDRLRGYSIPVGTLTAESLREALEVYRRLNGRSATV